MAKEKLSGICDARFISDDIEGTTSIYYDFEWFGEDSAVYNHQLARMLAQLTVAGYDKHIEDETQSTGYFYAKPNLTVTLEKLGFTDIECNPTALRDEVVYFIAHRDLTLEDATYNLLFTGFIGSYTKQWFSNFDPIGAERVCNDGKGYASDDLKGKIHIGFADATEYVYEKLNAYIERHPSEYETKLIAIGHSRGAAVANLLAARLIDDGGFKKLSLKPENIFAYCYATPNGVNLNEVENKESYSRIFSIVSNEDLVPACLPESLGFGKFGTVLKILGDDNKNKRTYSDEKEFMQPYFFEAFGMNTYHPFRRGSKAVQKVVDAMSKEIKTMEDFYEKPLRECFKTVTPFEYFRDTLCAYVAGGETEEEKAAVDRAQKLLLESSVDYVGTCSTYRTISSFFVFKEGIGSVTGNRVLKTNFSESHRPHTYAAYLLAMSEEQLMANTYGSDDKTDEKE